MTKSNHREDREPFHYTNCGLDYVYLVNGVEVHETPYGRGVAIENADGLHQAIAIDVVSSPQALRGQEVRFLRSLLEVSQAGLGDILGCSRATVARWEGARDTVIQGSPDRILRMFVAIKLSGYELTEQITDLLTEIGELEHQLKLFEETDLGWQRKAA